MRRLSGLVVALVATPLVAVAMAAGAEAQDRSWVPWYELRSQNSAPAARGSSAREQRARRNSDDDDNASFSGIRAEQSEGQSRKSIERNALRKYVRKRYIKSKEATN